MWAILSLFILAAIFALLAIWQEKREKRRYAASVPDGNVSSCYERQPGMVRYGANAYGSPELSTSWNFGLNIDLRPYLRNGANTIFMRVIVAGGGEGAIQMTTRQTCPLNCSVSTDNQCAALEARAQ